VNRSSLRARALVWAATLAAVPVPQAIAGRPVAAPARPLPAPPTLPLVRLEVARDHVVVVEDVLLRRGEWQSGDVDLFVSFGAPGVPRALDAHLSSAADDGTPQGATEVLPVERASRRPSAARLLLGTASMAGVVLRVSATLFDRATRSTGIARLRIRSLLDAPRPDARSGRELVVRLGAHQGEADPLEALEVAWTDPLPRLVRAEAHLCGKEADPYPLAIHGGAPFPQTPARVAPVAPLLSARHASDDLCIRYWAEP